MFSDTCRCCGGLVEGAKPNSRESRGVDRSETVLALVGGKPGGGCSALLNPSVLGSIRNGAVGALAKPMVRGSADLGGELEMGGREFSWLGRETVLRDCDSSAADGMPWPACGGDGLSSLLGGVLKGDTLASKEGRL